MDMPRIVSQEEWLAERKALLDLFDGRRQLTTYHFMFDRARSTASRHERASTSRDRRTISVGNHAAP